MLTARALRPPTAGRSAGAEESLYLSRNTQFRSETFTLASQKHFLSANRNSDQLTLNKQAISRELRRASAGSIITSACTLFFQHISCTTFYIFHRKTP